MTNPFETICEHLNRIEEMLSGLNNTTGEAQTEPQEEIMTVQQTAEFLNLSVPTIYGMIHRGDVPVMKRGKRCYFSKADLIQYLKAGRRKSNDERVAEETNRFNAKRKGGRNA